MKNFLLSKIRLTAYYPLFFITFLVVIYVAPKLQLTGSQLTLFSVNSFLLAFYLGPIMSAQKQRLDDLAKAIRSEAIAFFTVAIQTQDMTQEAKREVKTMARRYLQSCLHTRNIAEGEREYENMLRLLHRLRWQIQGPNRKSTRYFDCQPTKPQPAFVASANECI